MRESEDMSTKENTETCNENGECRFSTKAVQQLWQKKNRLQL